MEEVLEGTQEDYGTIASVQDPRQSENTKDTAPQENISKERPRRSERQKTAPAYVKDFCTKL